MQVVVHVDGGARGNPGPAAAAAVVSAPDGRVLDEAAVTLGRATNNVAEYRGVLLGVERAKALGATAVELVGDSELVAKQIRGEYKVKHADLVPLHAEARKALQAFDRWSIRTVPRADNAAADALVNRALDGEEVAPGAPPPAPEDSAAPGAHDEPAAVLVSEAFEPWLRLILQELTAAQDALAEGRPHVAAPRLRTVVAVWRLLDAQLDVLETMGPETLRDPLAPPQLGEIGWLSGASLYEAFAGGLGLPAERAPRIAALGDLYRDHERDPLRAAWHGVAELLVDHDEGAARWRHHQALMAARARPGNGDPPDVALRFFPDLWDVRRAL